jgi:hypothetical protein
MQDGSFLGELSWCQGTLESHACLYSDICKIDRLCSCDCVGEDGAKRTNWRDLPFTTKDEGLIRRLWKVPRLRGLKPGTKWGYAFGAYLRTVPKEVHALVISAYRWLPDCCEECFIDVLKELSRVSLERVLHNDERWRLYLLDLKVLGGFDTVLNRQDPFESYDEDYGTKSSQELDDRLKFWIDDTIGKIGVDMVDFDFEEFVSFRDAWALPGASIQGTAKKAQIVDSKGGRRSIRVKDKWFATAHMTDEQIVTECKKEQMTLVRPFVKQDEPAACRTVQCYDTWSLVRASYIDQAIGDLNQNGLWTSVGMGSKEKQDLRRRMMSWRDEWKMCTDQGSFDTHQSAEWVMYALEALYAKIASVNPHMKEVIEIELKSLRNVKLEFDGRRIDWKNGVLSGYKFTALVDSILNRAETRWVLEKMKREDIWMECYQGDDAIVVLRGGIEKEKVAEVYSELGLEVNPEKTWVTRGSTEYLHEVYLSNRVVGFPARAFRAMLWKKPLTNILSAERGKDKLEAFLSVCRMAVRRGLHAKDVVWRMLKQYGAKEVDRFTEWWMTPYVFGGFGAGTTGRCKLNMKTIKEKGVNYRLHVSGLSHMGVVWMEAALLRSEGKIPIPGIHLELDWEKVKGEPRMEKLKADRLREEPRVKVDWTVEDLTLHKDAYERKLKLEWKLRTGATIVDSDLPRKMGYFGDLDRAYRTYRSLINDVRGIDETSTAGESHYRVTDWMNEVWAGICYRRIRIGAHVDFWPLARLVHTRMLEVVYKRQVLVVLV